MSTMATMWLSLAVTTAIVAVWLYRVNRAFRAVPEEAARASPRRWTKNELRETYERLKKKPLDFTKNIPPRLDRRYIVVGGSGVLPPAPKLDLIC
jgi:biopolymer transport protein ExbB/TolQ